MTLSIRRAETVAAWLGANGGGAEARIAGYGETTPAYPNTTAEGRQGNRRVVITVSRDGG